jgi:inhibitor of cysteine peptidase
MKKNIVIWVLVGVFCAACGISGNTPAPGGPAPTGGEVVYDEASVDKVEIVFLESFPLQVLVTASGYLPNPCSWVDKIDVNREGQEFQVEITSGQNAGEICIQVEDAFVENIPLDVYGLSAGDYTVEVNGIKAQFTFTQDNILKDGG